MGEGKLCEFMGFLGREPVQDGSARHCIEISQRGPLACEARDNGRCGGCMARIQRCIDRLQRRVSCCSLGGDEEIHFGAMKTTHRSARGQAPLLTVSSILIGLAVFLGSLARPFQVTRHWSRSQPLPRSRSSQ